MKRYLWSRLRPDAGRVAAARRPAAAGSWPRLVAAVGVAAFSLAVLLAGVPVSAADRAGVPDIRRFGQVDERLFRGGQPDRAGYEALRAAGVRTVINLRYEHDERDLVESLGFEYVSIPLDLSPFGIVTRMPDTAVRRFFEVVDDPSRGPVFVHCRRGADRTGLAVGLYRIARHHWDASAAYDEARKIGMRWWYTGFKGQLNDFARSVFASNGALAPPPPLFVSPGLAISSSR